jgi:hypothetical protein
LWRRPVASMRTWSRDAGASLTISAHRKRLTRRASTSHELGTATTRPAAAYARASLAPATLCAYRTGWQAFSEWCQLAGRAALQATPEAVAGPPGQAFRSAAASSLEAVRALTRPCGTGRNGTGQVDREGQDPSMGDAALSLMVISARQSSPHERAASLHGQLRAVPHRRSRPGCAAGSEPAALQLRLSPDL